MSAGTPRDVPSRRTILAGGAAALGLSALTGSGAAASTRGRTDPFTLGVASGDPSHDGFVLWTRLATDPLAEDSSGGMPSSTVDVEWEIAADERFTRIVRRGVEQAVPELAHSVQVEAAGTEFTGDPDNPHFRFHDDMRGYVRTKITDERLRADFRVLPYVSEPHASADTKVTFTITDRVPGLRETAPRRGRG